MSLMRITPEKCYNETGDFMKHIFWGLVFIFFHFRIIGIDLLPDFLGYLFVSFGLYSLAVKSVHFKRSLLCSAALFLMQLVHLLTFIGIRFHLLVYLILDFSSVFASLMMLYFIVMGLKDLAAQKLLKMNTQIFMNIWFVQAISQTIGFLLSFTFSDLAYMLSAYAAMVTMAANVLFLFYFYRAKKSMSV